MAKQVKEITDPNEAFAALGINAPATTPEGEAVTTEQVGLPNEEQQPAQQTEPQQEEVDTSTTIEFADEEEETKPEEKAKPEEKKPDEEEQRRSWQSEADKARAELEKVQAQMGMLQAQNQQLVGVVQPFLQKYGDPQQPGAQQQNSEPKADFIVDGYFDGEKFAQYQQKRDDWLANKLADKVTGTIEKKQQQQSLQQQLNAVAEEFPEFVNPITGQVDAQRVHSVLERYTNNKSIVELLRDATGKAASKQNVKDTGLAESLKKIEENANRPRPVSGASETETKQKVTVPKKLKEIHDFFGEMELPPNFDGIV